jgi:hypothetical protein
VESRNRVRSSCLLGIETTSPRRIVVPGRREPGSDADAAAATQPAPAKARGVEATQAPAMAGTSPAAAARAPGFKEMAAPAPAANAAAATRILQEFLRNYPEIERFPRD